MDKRNEERFKTAMQVLAILALAAICLTILHKDYVDVSALAKQHPGQDFWLALARYVFRNLAGG